jgi:hypothetical protein
MIFHIKEFLFNKPLLVTTIFTLCSFWTSLTVNGLYNVALESILRRYELSYTFMSTVPATYGITQVLLVIPLTYRFGRKYKAKMIGGSLILFSLGCFIYGLPHLLAGNYIPIKEQECPAICQSKLHKIKYLFNIAYFLIGAGNIPMVTLTLSYIHENNIHGPIDTNYHYALYHAGTAFGPAVGMLIGGQLGKVWVDSFGKNLDPPGDIDPSSKLWVGTWWLAYWIVSIAVFLLGVFISVSLPETLVTSVPDISCNESMSSTYKGQDDTVSNRTESTMVSCSNSVSSSFQISRKQFKESIKRKKVKGEGHDWSDLLPSYRKICKNLSFLGMTGACTADMAFVSIISMYGIQYLSEVYHIAHSNSSIIFSASLSTVMLALPLSGYICKDIDKTKSFDLEKTLKFMRFATGMATIALLSLFMTCDDSKFYFAGGDVAYNQLNLNNSWIQSNNSEYYQFNNKELYGYCSEDEDRIDPMCPCGSDEFIPICADLDDGRTVTFFNPCHLGCQIRTIEPLENQTKALLAGEPEQTNYIVDSCNCIDASRVRFGSCATFNCDWRIYIIVPSLVLTCFCTFLQVVPGTMVTQALVPDHLRTAGLGFQNLIFRSMGTIPWPIFAARIIDSKCIWWGSTCVNERGACRAFDKLGMRTSFVSIVFSLKIMAIISYTIAIRFLRRVDHLRHE